MTDARREPDGGSELRSGARPAPSGGPAGAGLDLAFGWLQRGLDQLTEATRRNAQVATDRPGRGRSSPEPAAAAPATAPRGRDEPASPTLAGGPGATPLLDKLGRDLTKLAAEGLLRPVIGREAETDWLIEVLVRTAKRNPVLLGPAGVGKTAIVEGLAQRIVAERVPKPLLGTRIVEVPLASLTAGTQYRGQLEERIAALVAEASQPGIVLFFDEIHLLAGVGRTEGGVGVAEALKPALARGDLAVIGATTAEEYRRTIELDTALARRLTTIGVAELDKAATRSILLSVRDALARSRGVTASDEALDVLLDFADRSIANARFPDKAIDLLEQAIAHAIVAGATTVDRPAAVIATEDWAARASSTPTLQRFGRDLVALARDGRLGPIVGRDRELDAIVEVLLRRTKRNPLLVGPAGSGKTAIVEGLALRIAAGTVPEPIRDIHLFDVPLLSLAAGIGDDPAALDDLLVEVRHPSVVVFFDEIHQLTSAGVHDLAESLKPALARGEIACIGATTAEEYQARLEPETALARRFTEIPVEPMGMTAVRDVLDAVRGKLAKLRGVTLTDAALDELVALATQFLPNRSFPDKGVDVIEQSVAYAVSHGATTVDPAMARAAVAAMIGMPLEATASLTALATTLRERALLDPPAADALLARLAVSLRGLDARAERPDATILLCDGAAAGALPLARAVAAAIFGRETAVIDLDLAALTDDSSISTLLGSAPGLIGSDRPLPLHELRRSPWAVVLFRGIDTCAIAIREAVAAGLASGSLTDAMGRRIPLGAAIVVLTAPAVGAGTDAPTTALLAARLGPVLTAACDVITGAASSATAEDRERWVRRELLDPLAARLARAGYPATFTPAFAAWLEAALPADGTPLDAFVDQQVAAAIATDLPPAAGPIEVDVAAGRPTVVAAPARETAASS